MWVIYVALLILFVYILDDYLLDKRQYELSKKFNGPKRWPILGNTIMFLKVSPKGRFHKKNMHNYLECIFRIKVQIFTFYSFR